MTVRARGPATSMTSSASGPPVPHPWASSQATTSAVTSSRFVSLRISWRALGQRYRDAGLVDVTVKLYDGARHEILNETNRDEVTSDVVAWLDAHG